MLFLTAAVLVIFALVLHFRLQAKHRKQNPKQLPLPPGPKGLPIIGNVLDMPKTDMWLTAAEWGDKYGDVVYVENFGRPLIFLNSYKVTVDLLESRSSIYSDRPPFPMLNDIIGWDWALAFMPYGERFRKHHEFLHRYLQPTAARSYQDLQYRETCRLVVDLIKTPHDYDNHLRRAAAAIIMMIAYGHEVAPEGDLFVSLAKAGSDTILLGGVPDAFLVNVLPWLKYIPAWFPGAGFKRKGREWRKSSQAMLHTPYAMTKEKIFNGDAKPSMTSDLISRNTDSHEQIQDEDIIAGCTAMAYIGGADTTVSTLSFFLLALLLYPEVQMRGQEEIDRVVGEGRLPTFEDRSSLLYVEGIVRESLRWNLVVPLGVPHRLMVDDEYNGYFIPAGCTVLANQWAMLHDKDEYTNPEAFMPERWLSAHNKEGPRHPNKAAFGFGRRLCPGRHVADNSIYIAVATILATSNVKKALDKDGNPIEPSRECISGLAIYPKPFECAITPRSPKAIALVHEAVESQQ